MPKFQPNRAKPVSAALYNYLSDGTAKSWAPQRSFTQKVIYCFSVPHAEHSGLVKVGETTYECPIGMDAEARKALVVNAAKKRIKKIVGALGGSHTLHWALSAPRVEVRDEWIHRELERIGIDNVIPGDSSAEEWYRTHPDEALRVTKQVFRGFSARLDATQAYTLRAEQALFVSNALAAWQAGHRKRLWDAKMRFGKTLTAYEFIGQAHETAPDHMSRVLILTHRPEVESGWFDEFARVFGEGRPHGHQKWRFAGKNRNLGLAEVLDGAAPFVYFSSMQDARGKDPDDPGKFKSSNQALFGLDWDLIIVDEAHEGNRTPLAREVHSELERRFTLYLSGTPYKYLAESDFSAEEMDTWDYVQEQQAKHAWAESSDNFGLPNPYGGLPQMWIYALDMAETIKTTFDEESQDIAFSLAEMFKTKNKRFEREQEVRDFLAAITSATAHQMPDGTELIMPFAEGKTPHEHTLWVLPPNTEACAALQKLLEAHPKFADYKIVNVAGSKVEGKALETVQKAIRKNRRTITLTVGRLTTGVTVPEWTAVLMLNTVTSAENYMQTIFRAQSPYTTPTGDEKTECFVYDFAPDRVLTVLTQVSGVSGKAGMQTQHENRERLATLLNYMPVITAVGAKDLRPIDAGSVSTAIKRIYRDRVLNAGFDSPLLFIRDTSGLTPDVRAALDEVRSRTKSSAPRTSNPPRDLEIRVGATEFADLYTDDNQRRVEEIEGISISLRTEQEEEELRQRKAEQTARQEACRRLATVSVRIPLLLIGLMAHGPEYADRLKHQFSLSDFMGLIDDDSWGEYFQDIPKDLFLRLIPAFDADVFQVSVRGWVEDLEAAFRLRDMGDTRGYAMAISEILSKVKNPNSETVFTPWRVVERTYSSAGVQEVLLTERAGWKAHSGNRLPTFYDINLKSGAFPLYAATLLANANPGQSWSDICDQAIFGNARTQAGKWIACALLGKPADWRNITIIDVNEELKSTDLTGLSDTQKERFLGYFLCSPFRITRLDTKTNTTIAPADIEDVTERKLARKRVAVVEPSEDIRFDFVISNPPYQVSQGDNSKQIYDKFYFVGRSIAKRMTMVFPLGWQKSSGKAAGSVRHAEIRADRRIVSVDNYLENGSSPVTLFPDVGTGGVNIICWSEDHDNKGEVLLFEHGMALGKRDLTKPAEFPKATREVADRLAPFIAEYGSLSEVVTGWNPFGVRSYIEKPARKENAFLSEKPGPNRLRLFYDRQDGEPRFVYVSKDLPGLKQTHLDRWKTVFPCHGPHRVWRDVHVLPPGTLVTDRFIAILSDSEEEAEAWGALLKTDFVVAIMNETAALQGAPQHALSTVYRHVPNVNKISHPRTKKAGILEGWTDADFKAAFRLTGAQAQHLREVATRVRGEHA